MSESPAFGPHEKDAEHEKAQDHEGVENPAAPVSVRAVSAVTMNPRTIPETIAFLVDMHRIVFIS